MTPQPFTLPTSTLSMSPNPLLDRPELQCHILIIITLTGADDFMASSSTVAFDANTMNMVECITVTINNDTNFESAENFTFQLTMTDNNLLMIDPSHITATITILDVDGKAFY